MTGKWHGLVIDTPDPRGFTTFYQELLGFVRVQDEDHWVVIGDAADWPGWAFQLAPDLQPPGWPGGGPPQQMHLDITVDDIEQAEEQALSLGAVRLPLAVRLSGSIATRQGTRFVCAFKISLPEGPVVTPGPALTFLSAQLQLRRIENYQVSALRKRAGSKHGPTQV